MGLIHSDIEEGQEFSGPSRILSVERILAFSGGPIGNSDWPAKNLHTDFGKAKEAGLNAPIASGLQYEGYLIQLLIDVFGGAWFQNGKLHIKYPKPVVAGDTVQAKVRIGAKKQSDACVEFGLDVWCETRNGEKVLVGTANCTLPLAS